MVLEIPKVRPAVIDADPAKALGEYLRFRHYHYRDSSHLDGADSLRSRRGASDEEAIASRCDLTIRRDMLCRCGGWPVASSLLAPARVDYPSSDGQPMAETDHQRTPLTYAVDRLRRHFRNRPDVYVSGNLFIYYEEGNPRAVVAPDVFVVLGADRADRSTYRLWEEPKAPDFVLEITSRSTRREDQVHKRELYRSLGVREYWQFDPTNDYLRPPLQGLELVAGDYRRLPARELEGGMPALASVVLGLELRLTERGLRLHDPRTGKDLPNLDETDDARQHAEQEQQRERQARQHAEQARHEAESRLAHEAAARTAAEARVAELEARLRQAGGDDPAGGQPGST